MAVPSPPDQGGHRGVVGREVAAVELQLEIELADLDVDIQPLAVALDVDFEIDSVVSLGEVEHALEAGGIVVAVSLTTVMVRMRVLSPVVVIELAPAEIIVIVVPEVRRLLPVAMRIVGKIFRPRHRSLQE